jgi:Transposase DDE domain
MVPLREAVNLRPPPHRELTAASFSRTAERRRQRICDDRRLYRARSPAQCWRSKKNGPQAIGRSRGGLTTKIHALVDALGNPVKLMLTPGQDHDLTCAEPLIENADPEALVGDKAYDAELKSAIMEYLENHNSDPKPFIWTKSASEILEKVTRAKQALESQH